MKRIITSLGWAAFIIWGLLTILVVVFLIDRWRNPGRKGISDNDLLDYANFSLWLLGIFVASRLAPRLQTFTRGKKNR